MKWTADNSSSIPSIKRRGTSEGTRKSQSGLTLVELIIALAIISLIAGVTVMAIHQLLTASRQANDQQYAVSQLRQAEHWMTRDALMAQQVIPGTSGVQPFPLELRWTTSGGVSHEVIYSLEPAGGLLTLKRHTETQEEDGTTTTSSLILAQGIDDAPGSQWEYASRVLTVTLTATSRSHTETRIFTAKLRSDLAT